MKFSTFIPDAKAKGCLIWLSGLTCTDENFITKAGAQKYLAESGLMVICPDTSPRGPLPWCDKIEQTRAEWTDDERVQGRNDPFSSVCLIERMGSRGIVFQDRKDVANQHGIEVAVAFVQ